MMVFCYKIITESPSRSHNVSPRRKSTTEQRLRESATLLKEITNVPKELCVEDVLNSIPEREWRLLDALAKKRDEDEERQYLADYFHKMWVQEKEERELADAETTEQYKRYIHNKRQLENFQQRSRRTQKMTEQKLKEDLIERTIKNKEKRSRELLAWVNDKKNNHLIDKSLDYQARCYLAADRRYRQCEAEQFKHELEVFNTTVRLNRARRKRNNILKEASQRVAIQNVLTTWGSVLNKQEQEALDLAKRAAYAYQVALTEEKRKNLERAREAKLRQSRKVAEITRVLRDVVRNGQIPLKLNYK